MQDRLHRQFKAAVQPYPKDTVPTIPQDRIKGILSWIDLASTRSGTTTNGHYTSPTAWFYTRFPSLKVALDFTLLVNNSRTGFDAEINLDMPRNVLVRRDPAARKAVLA